MSLGEIISMIQLLTGAGIVGLVLAYVHRATRTAQERDRLIIDQKREKLKNDEKEIARKIDSVSLADLVDSAPIVRTSDDPE